LGRSEGTRGWSWCWWQQDIIIASLVHGGGWVFICGGVLVVVLSLHVGVVLVLLLGVFQFATIWHSNRQFRYEYAMSLKCPTESKIKEETCAETPETT